MNHITSILSILNYFATEIYNPLLYTLLNIICLTKTNFKFGKFEKERLAILMANYVNELLLSMPVMVGIKVPQL